jgi:hypothetical protein
MPYDVTTISLPCGTLAVRADGSGVITEDDANKLIALIRRGGPNFGMPMLVLTQRISEMSAEARRLLSHPTSTGVEAMWCAVVVAASVIRVTVNFITRTTGGGDSLKMFSSEPDAIAWLDERIRVDGPHPSAKT